MENQNPKLINNRIDLKSFTYECFSASIKALRTGEIENVSIGPNTTAIVLTNFGIVEGTPIEISESKNSSNKNINEVVVNSLISAVFSGRNNQILKLENENNDLKLINDTSALILKDVVITPYANPANKVNLGNLILFSDQIVGLSFGEKKTEGF